MKRSLCFLLSFILLAVLSACDSKNQAQPEQTVSIQQTVQSPLLKQSQMAALTESAAEDGMVRIQITAGDRAFTATLYDNQAAKDFLKQLPMTVTMDELNGNEKFYYLPERLPTETYRPSEIKAGDLMLYGSDCLVLFYEGLSSSFSYTKLGFIEDVTGLSDALGSGSTQISFLED